MHTIGLVLSNTGLAQDLNPIPSDARFHYDERYCIKQRRFENEIKKYATCIINHVLAACRYLINSHMVGYFVRSQDCFFAFGYGSGVTTGAWMARRQQLECNPCSTINLNRWTVPWDGVSFRGEYEMDNKYQKINTFFGIAYISCVITSVASLVAALFPFFIGDFTSVETSLIAAVLSLGLLAVAILKK